MATATMATAAAAAALLYYTLNRKLQSSTSRDDDENDNLNGPSNVPLGIERVSHRLIQAPATWLETISTLSETLRFTYSETLGKWPIGDLAFGINFLLKRQVSIYFTVLLLSFYYHYFFFVGIKCFDFMNSRMCCWCLEFSINGLHSLLSSRNELVDFMLWLKMYLCI